MFEYLSEEDYQEHLRQEKARGTLQEQLKRKIEIDKKKEALKNQELEEERKRLEDLHNQERQNLLNIQTDIKLKLDNNELSLSEEQIIEKAQKAKSSPKIIRVEEHTEEEQYYNLKEYWNKFLDWKIERKKQTGREYSNSTIKSFNLSYKYLLEFLNGNEDYNICHFKKRFFIDLQENLKKLPSEFGKYQEFKNKTVSEIVAMKIDYTKFPRMGNNSINSFFGLYDEFFKYMVSNDYLEKNVLDGFVRLVKTPPEKKHEHFTDEEICKLFNNDIEQDNKTMIENFLKFAFYTGMRVGEITQLRKNDIIEKDGVYCFNVIEDLEEGRRVKNKGSVRIVPIHPNILDLVFELKETSKNDYFFWSHKSTSGDRVNEFIKEVLKSKKKTLHSTRSTFINRTRKYANAEIVELISGHTDTSQNTSYAGGTSELRTTNDRYEVVKMLKYDCLEK
ncbi:MAG: tyrosine-type recombinase/integrase [Epsilonproteobacteria bacterium]|nr:tyrosine-type recombinase/integrase [Campylobacterota bacterium]